MANEIIIVGGFHEVIELAEDIGMKIIGIIDNLKLGTYMNISVIGNDKNAKHIIMSIRKTPLVLTPDLPNVRNSLYIYYKEIGFDFISLISNNAKISKSATIKTGTIVQSGVNISSEVQIGCFVKLNSGCNIMHNSIIRDFSTIAPNAVVLGNVQIGKFCYLGANSTILPNIKICDYTTIGAGAVVTKDITLSGTYVGVPAKYLKKQK